MLPPQRLSSLAPLLLALLTPATADPVVDGGTQFIYYPGNVTGSFVHNVSAYGYFHPGNGRGSSWTEVPCGDNGTYHFSIPGATHMRIGVNPPEWDANPFFFEYEREVDNLHWSTIWAMHLATTEYEFATTEYDCTRDDSCVPSKHDKGYFVSLPQVNLSEAEITTVMGEADPFYSVKGDQRTFAGNETINRSFLNFEEPLNYTVNGTQGQYCVDGLDIHWNKTTTFTYAVNFTNTTVSASYSFTVPDGVLSLAFVGERSDDEKKLVRDFWPYNPVSLQDPASYSLPNFTFVNDTKISWAKNELGRWRPTSSASGRRSGVWGGAGAILAVAAALLYL